MTTLKKKLDSLVGHFFIGVALFVGFLINVSADIVYDLVKDNPTILYSILALTIGAFVVVIATYHHKIREPLGKMLQEFE